MPAPSSRTAPALPPKVIGFRATIDSSAKVDAAAGTIAGIAVVTGNLQPIGWPMWVDAATLRSFLAAFSAIGPAKSYITHDGAAYSDRMTKEAGLFAGYRIDGETFRADFAALDAFRKHEAKEFDKLFELAAKAPASFGVSPVFTYRLSWVRQNGEEIPTDIARYSWNESAGNYVPEFEPSMPADSKTPLPCVRDVTAMSIDFTDCPAANPGLWTARPPVDAPANGNPPTANPPAMSLHKQLFAKFRSNPAQFARATELHESDEKLSLDSIIATVEREGTAAEIGTLRADLTKRDGEIATLRTSITEKDAKITTLEAQAVKDAAAIAAFRKGPAAGTTHVPTGEAGAEGGETDPVAKLRAEIEGIKGTDEASAKKRGELTAKLRALKNKK